MSKVIDLSQGYGALSEQDKLYLASRGKLPKEHISEGIRTALNLSGEASSVAYGAHTGTVATMTDDELEAELNRRKAQADAAYKGDDPQKALMPGLDNPHSERLDLIKETQETFDSEKDAKHAAATKAAAGPVVPSLGAPGTTQRTEVNQAADDEEDEEDEDEGLSPEDYASPDTATTNRELRAEISRRNEGRADEDKIPLGDNKAELVAALQADDEDDETE